MQTFLRYFLACAQTTVLGYSLLLSVIPIISKNGLSKFNAFLKSESERVILLFNKQNYINTKKTFCFGKRMAIYKDDSGKITALNPTCTHAGCIVQFNPLEQSWDCPCHGGRFDVSGKVLNGPPSSNLEMISVSGLIPLEKKE